MKTFSVIFMSAVLATLCPSALSDIAMKLDALRPDVEYLRGYWLKNPEEYDRQGRIIFSDKHEIRINNGFPFDSSACPTNDDQWTNETLFFENIDRMFDSEKNMLPNASLFYKHGRFFSNSDRCAPLTPLDDTRIIVQVPSTTLRSDGKETVVVRYIDLRTLGLSITRQIEKENLDWNHDVVSGSEGFYVRHGVNLFYCVCDEECRFVDVDNVRVTDPIPGLFYNDDHKPHWIPLPVDDSSDNRRASISSTTDYSFIRYDRLRKSFYTPRDDLLQNSLYVRNVSDDFVLRKPVVSHVIPWVEPPRRRRRPLRNMIRGINKIGKPLIDTVANSLDLLKDVVVVTKPVPA